ncbi:DUF4105 domain-containing protein [Stutzerimonas kirkiae]|uniref:Lnb N-terminal periplasmic domain-containing protein n=1 Tax=Stutzerimonas kirkiae TaxID=2211392 RepID=UPI001F603CFF|nr:DUF4105 domain-containing protein [Stutzerimonas kirkiae]
MPGPTLRHWLTRSLLSLAILLCSLWGGLALYYRLPLEASLKTVVLIVLALAVLAALASLWRNGWRGLAGFVLGFAILQFWWHSLAPSNERDWADDVMYMAQGRIENDIVTLPHVRNFDWRSDEDYTPRWENRRYDLGKLASVDLITSYWGMSAIAHVLVSFGFETGEFVTFSVEIRKERHERYSEIGGFFKEFELSIIAADERDVVRVRSNVRGEDEYLYRVDMPRDVMRSLFLSYVEQANELVRKPRFYHTVTANCTTLVFGMMQHIVGGLPLDYRLLLSGYLPEYVHSLDGFTPGFGLEQLRERGRFTDRALASDASEDFSRAIRRGVPGWESLGQDLDRLENAVADHTQHAQGADPEQRDAARRVAPREADAQQQHAQADDSQSDP